MKKTTVIGGILGALFLVGVIAVALLAKRFGYPTKTLQEWTGELVPSDGTVISADEYARHFFILYKTPSKLVACVVHPHGERASGRSASITDVTAHEGTYLSPSKFPSERRTWLGWPVVTGYAYEITPDYAGTLGMILQEDASDRDPGWERHLRIAWP